MFLDGKAGLGEHEGLAHIVLSHRSGDIDHALRMKAMKLRSIFRDLVTVAPIVQQLGEGPAVHQHNAVANGLLAPTQPVNADAGTLEVARVGWLMQPDKELHVHCAELHDAS